MSERVLLYIAFAIFVTVMVLYRQLAIAMVEAYGLPSAAAVILACYLLARHIHRKERGY